MDKLVIDKILKDLHEQAVADNKLRKERHIEALKEVIIIKAQLYSR